MKTPLGLVTSVSASGRYYALEKEVGRGAYGVVYKGHDVNCPDRTVAIKYPHPDQEEVDAILLAQSRTMREAGFLQMISHPHVVSYVDHRAEHHSSYVVMGYVSKTLATITITPQIIEDYIGQIPEVLTVLRESNVAHCDLQAGNIGYSLDATPSAIMLLDFGLAAPFHHNFFYSGFSPQPYHPPELHKAGLVSRGTDVYSAGLVLERMVVGEYISSSTKAIERMRQLYGTSPPKSFTRFLSGMLHSLHFRRFSPEQLQEAAPEVISDLHRREYFSRMTVPLSDAGIDFGLSSSSSR